MFIPNRCNCFYWLHHNVIDITLTDNFQHQRLSEIKKNTVSATDLVLIFLLRSRSGDLLYGCDLCKTIV